MQQPAVTFEPLERAPTTSVLSCCALDYVGTLDADRILKSSAEFLGANVQTSDMAVYERNIRKFLALANADAAWFTIRLSKRTNAFMIPRWHRDSRMFRTGKSYKYAVTLLGAPTRAVHETPDIAEALADKKYDDRRTELAEKLAHAKKIHLETPVPFMFTCGEPSSLIHSEPDITGDRIFMSLVPGTEQQLRELANLRKLQYTE